jgi:hypothetical protein
MGKQKKTKLATCVSLAVLALLLIPGVLMTPGVQALSTSVAFVDAPYLYSSDAKISYVNGQSANIYVQLYDGSGNRLYQWFPGPGTSGQYTYSLSEHSVQAGTLYVRAITQGGTLLSSASAQYGYLKMTWSEWLGTINPNTHRVASSAKVYSPGESYPLGTVGSVAFSVNSFNEYWDGRMYRPVLDVSVDAYWYDTNDGIGYKQDLVSFTVYVQKVAGWTTTTAWPGGVTYGSSGAQYNSQITMLNGDQTKAACLFPNSFYRNVYSIPANVLPNTHPGTLAKAAFDAINYRIGPVPQNYNKDILCDYTLIGMENINCVHSVPRMSTTDINAYANWYSEPWWDGQQLRTYFKDAVTFNHATMTMWNGQVSYAFAFWADFGYCNEGESYEVHHHLITPTIYLVL